MHTDINDRDMHVLIPVMLLLLLLYVFKSFLFLIP